MSKRQSVFDLPLAKRTLATPPTTPQKSRIKDLTNVLTTSPHKNRSLSFLTPPSTPTKPSQTSVYSRAKALFQRSSSEDLDQDGDGCLVGRSEEALQLNEFLESSLKTRQSRSLYISGPPGTGKTAQVDLSFKRLEQKYPQRVRVIKINCMTVANAENIFHEIYSQLDMSRPTRRKTCEDLIARLAQRSGIETVVLLLDELDFLITQDQQVLFQLFNLVSLKQLRSNIIIVSISNALDLTDKFLPRLKSNNLSPDSLQFFPYTADQIKQICIHKLTSLVARDKENQREAIPTGFIPIIHPAAIQLCCRKSASITGDLRKAFDICYKGIEMLENELRATEKQPGMMTALTAPKVLISHIAKVCAVSFGENIATRLGNLNLLQKVILCCLLNLESKRPAQSIFATRVAKSKANITVNRLFDHYVSKTAQISEGFLGTLRKGEFLEIVGALEASSLVSIQSCIVNANDASGTGGFEISNKFISANVLYIDATKMINEVGILQRVLHCD